MFQIVTPILILVFGMLNASCSTSILNAEPADCGFSAYYDTKENNGKIEIIFSRVTAEVVGGHRNCGFGYIRSKVDRAEIDGIALPERLENDVYFYAAPNGFDPRKNTITIQTGKDRYISDLASVKEVKTSFYISLKAQN